MVNQQKLAIAVGIGAVVGIGMTFLAIIGIGKKTGGAYLGMCHRKKIKPSHICDWAFLFRSVYYIIYNY